MTSQPQPEVIQDTGCCPRFDPGPWEEQFFVWEDKKFIKGSVFTLYFMPVNFGRVVRRLTGLAEAAGATTPDWMGLSDHTSRWNMDFYLAVDKEVPGAENVSLNGRFFTKVYEGAFRQTGEWCDDYEAVAKEKGLDIKKWYMWYTTCPKCAKAYGENYVVIVGEIA